MIETTVQFGTILPMTVTVMNQMKVGRRMAWKLLKVLKVSCRKVNSKLTKWNKIDSESITNVL